MNANGAPVQHVEMLRGDNVLNDVYSLFLCNISFKACIHI